jgi:RHS repeat-associated protein
MGRRISKKVWSNTAGTGSPALERRFLYDGWNLVAELDGANALVCSYLWGLDLSGTRQGAGGVGGLIAMKSGTSAARFAAFDGNGNVMAFVDGSGGQIDVRYEYGPFGESIRSTGNNNLNTINPFRFSTKYQDNETDFYYYGHRFYDSKTGRWPNRDPIEEKGSLNLSSYVNNNAVHLIDPLGLEVGWFGNPFGSVDVGIEIRPKLYRVTCTLEKEEVGTPIAGKKRLCTYGCKGLCWPRYKVFMWIPLSEVCQDSFKSWRFPQSPNGTIRG